MNLLELLDRNPNGWGNMPPAQPSQGEIRGRQPTLWDWWNTPIQEGERGGMAPLGTDIYGREVLAAPQFLVDAYDGATHLGNNALAAVGGNMGRVDPEDFGRDVERMNALAGTVALGSSPVPRPTGSVGMFGGKMAQATDKAAATTGRSLDELGYYSQLLENAKNLKQAKGTPEQMLAQMKPFKQAEFDATKLGELFNGKNAVTRDEIISHLENNRVRLNEVVRNGDDETKWSNYSLDPYNPTYSETVLHLPDSEGAFAVGHFPEPNVTGHTMTSMTKHDGRPVYTIDQIQSDWGQMLRDGGIRDEAKIADLERRYLEASKIAEAEQGRLPTLGSNIKDADILAKQKFGDEATWANLSDEQRHEVAKLSAANAETNRNNSRINLAAMAESDRLEAELNKARSTATGHPLVNTTDQWTTTTLRRALRQAAEAEADYVAIPSGDTVLSYNPGDAHGMRTFYNEIVPKNARNVFTKELGYKPEMLRVDQLETPTNGLSGQGFTLLSLPPEIRARIIKEGLPLFSNHPLAGLAANAAQQPGGLFAEPGENRPVLFGYPY